MVLRSGGGSRNRFGNVALSHPSSVTQDRHCLERRGCQGTCRREKMYFASSPRRIGAKIRRSRYQRLASAIAGGRSRATRPLDRPARGRHAATGSRDRPRELSARVSLFPRCTTGGPVGSAIRVTAKLSVALAASRSRGEPRAPSATSGEPRRRGPRVSGRINREQLTRISSSTSTGEFLRVLWRLANSGSGKTTIYLPGQREGGVSLPCCHLAAASAFARH